MAGSEDAALQERVARALVERGEPLAAKLLTDCVVRVAEDGNDEDADAGNDSLRVVEVEIAGPPEAQAILCDDGHPLARAIRAAVRSSLPPGAWIQSWTFLTMLVDDALTEDGDKANGVSGGAAGEASNQAADLSDGIRVWQNLRFRSESELRVAQALDRAGVLFLPNCKARLGEAGHRENREPDFLVCAEGKWGILEVDGEPFHPPARTVHDHERARLFKAHGIRVVEHFDAAACYRDPDGVVRQFLALLRQA